VYNTLCLELSNVIYRAISRTLDYLTSIFLGSMEVATIFGCHLIHLVTAPVRRFRR
jgi:hypothetical protein